MGFTSGGLNHLDLTWEKRNFAMLMGWLAAGHITLYISHRLPLAQAATALKLVIARQVIEKVVLV